MERVKESSEQVHNFVRTYRKKYRIFMDKSAPHVKERWIAEGVLFTVFMLRVVLARGWYVECYALCIFLLNMFLGFLSPKFDPDLQNDLMSDDQEAGMLPTLNPKLNTQKDEDFRPFVRRVPEFHFWQLSITGTVLALASTLLRFLDIPVFWPILVVYFLALFALTMRRQIQHMIKYRYIPFDFGKKKFTAS